MKNLILTSVFLASALTAHAQPKAKISDVDKVKAIAKTQLKSRIKTVAIWGAATAAVGAVGAGIAYPYFKIDKSSERLDNSGRMVSKEITFDEVSEAPAKSGATRQ